MGRIKDEVYIVCSKNPMLFALCCLSCSSWYINLNDGVELVVISAGMIGSL